MTDFLRLCQSFHTHALKRSTQNKTQESFVVIENFLKNQFFSFCGSLKIFGKLNFVSEFLLFLKFRTSLLLNISTKLLTKFGLLWIFWTLLDLINRWKLILIYFDSISAMRNCPLETLTSNRNSELQLNKVHIRVPHFSQKCPDMLITCLFMSGSHQMSFAFLVVEQYEEKVGH